MIAASFERGRPASGRLVNKTRESVVANEVRLAATPWARFLGLMGHPPLAAGQALVLQPESSIHMFFMRFPLDVLFLDAEGRVLHKYESIRPWRISRIVRGSKKVVEMPPGSLGASGTAIGDVVALQD